MTRNKGRLTAVLCRLLFNMIAQDNKKHLIHTLRETAKDCTAYADELEGVCPPEYVQ